MCFMVLMMICWSVENIYILFILQPDRDEKNQKPNAIKQEDNNLETVDNIYTITFFGLLVSPFILKLLSWCDSCNRTDENEADDDDHFVPQTNLDQE